MTCDTRLCPDGVEISSLPGIQSAHYFQALTPYTNESSCQQPSRRAQYIMVYVCTYIFRCIFMKFGISMGLGVLHWPNAPNLQNWVYFWKILPQNTQFGPNLCFSAENGVLKGPKIVLFEVYSEWWFLGVRQHIHVQNLVEWKTSTFTVL